MSKLLKQPKTIKNLDLAPEANKTIVSTIALISKQSKDIAALKIKRTDNIRTVLTELRAYAKEVKASSPIFAKYPKNKLAAIVRHRVKSDEHTSAIVNTALTLMTENIEIKVIDKLSLSAIQYIIKKIADKKCTVFTATFTKKADLKTLTKAIKEERIKDAKTKATNLLKK